MRSDDRLRMDGKIAEEKRKREESAKRKREESAKRARLNAVDDGPMWVPHKRPSPMPDAFPDYPSADAGPTDFTPPKGKAR